jgi:hypothetical protein
MDRVLKLVYDNWLQQSFPFANGLPLETLPCIKKLAYLEGSPAVVKQQMGKLFDSFDCAFRSHNNLHAYFKKHCGEENIISTEMVKHDNAIYLYPIEAKSIASLYQEHQCNIEGTMVKYTLLDTIKPEMLESIINGKVKIIINFIHDPINTSTEIIEFEKYLKSRGVDCKNVIIVSGNLLDEPSEVNVWTGNLFATEAARDLKEFPNMGSLGYISDNVKPSDLDVNKIRSKRFISFNRQIKSREHRPAIAYLSLKYNLLNDGVFSFIDDNISHQQLVIDIRKTIPDMDNFELVTKIKNMLPYEIDTMKLPKEHKTGFNTNNNQKSLYEDSYFHIVSESRFLTGAFPFISEKTFRPILNLQPFIMVGNHGTLQELRRMGFKTFSPYIDESYDSEINPVSRMTKIEQEIKKLAGLTKQQLHDLYYSMQDILIHNQEHLTTFIDHNPYQQVFDNLKRETHGI